MASLLEQGIKRIEWAGRFMPVIKRIKERIKEEAKNEKPLKGFNILACLHITTETANLLIQLQELGANIVATASNPLSTQDDVVEALNKEYGMQTIAKHGVDNKTYQKQVKEAINYHKDKLHIIIDDGADVISKIHKNYPEIAKNVIGGQEETTTGVIRLRAMEKEGILKFPIIAVNESLTKHLFDNRYGTGQSTIDGILRATNILLAGSVVVVAGYGQCGKGIAQRAKGMGARVIITEVNPIKALEAVMDGYEVKPMKEAIKEADIVITATGNRDVVKIKDILNNEKDTLILCNAGHFDVEIPVEKIKQNSVNKKELRKGVIEYTLKDSNKKVIMLEDGRLINLAAAEGHPAQVMDMSFANQLYSVQYHIKNQGKLENKVYSLPQEIDELIASEKLKALNIEIEKLTPEQIKYMNEQREGT